MTQRRRLQLAVAAGVILLARAATADPAPTPPHGTTGAGSPTPGETFEHIESPSTLKTDGGTELRLPPGYFLDEPSWDRLNTNMRALQDLDTRLMAENQSMKASLASWQPGWWVVAGAVASGIALGWYLHEEL
jgi:hypothetical protein